MPRHARDHSVLRTSSPRGRGPDEISDVLGSPYYATPYYDKILRDAVLGPHSRQLVPVTRYYLLLKPPVVVDFEPQLGEGLFFVDEKRRFFHARGIPYVPVFIGERLTPAQFGQRVREARRLAEEGPVVAKEDAALRSADPPPDRLPPPVIMQIDREAMTILAADIRDNPNLRGGSRMKRLAAIKRRLIAERQGRVVTRLRLRLASPLGSECRRPREAKPCQESR